MCGILGGVFSENIADIQKRIQSGLGLLNHRGPDDKGYLLYDLESVKVVLGNTRLAIIDLSHLGHQPMCSTDQVFSLVLNGEIYNYLELRDELKHLGHSFRTKTDTEVLLYAWSQWGVDSIKKLQGMFAFAVFDAKKRTLTLVRDAFGIKPLYFHISQNDIVFASEINALLALSELAAKTSSRATADFLHAGFYDEAEHTFFEGVLRIEPGHYLTCKIVHHQLVVQKQKWWCPRVDQRADWVYDDAVNSVREALIKSVDMHLRSDAPLAFSMSGGIDSASLVSIATALTKSGDVQTFTFDAHGLDEGDRPWASLVSTKIGAKSTFFGYDRGSLVADLEDLLKAQGEPFGGPSIYAEYLLHKIAHEQGFKVMVHGHGADEMFSGYHGYLEFRVASLINGGEWRSLLHLIRTWKAQPGRGLPRSLFYLLVGGLAAKRNLSPNQVHRLVSGPKNMPAKILKVLHENSVEVDEEVTLDKADRQLVSALRYALTRAGLSQQLRYADRNSMRWSVEARTPFLDRRLTEMVLTMPEEYLLGDDGTTKRILRDAMRGIVAPEVLKRRDKIGFFFPFSDVEAQIDGRLLVEASNANGLTTRDMKSLLRVSKVWRTFQPKADFYFRWRLLSYLIWLRVFNVSAGNLELSLKLFGEERRYG